LISSTRNAYSKQSGIQMVRLCVALLTFVRNDMEFLMKKFLFHPASVLSIDTFVSSVDVAIVCAEIELFNVVVSCDVRKVKA
jgi:hypothetical protein